METKFKIGDRVRIVIGGDRDDTKVGQVGTVTEDSHFPWIHFDERTGYPGKIQGIPHGFADCIGEERLELVVEPAEKPFLSVDTNDGKVIVYADDVRRMMDRVDELERNKRIEDATDRYREAAGDYEAAKIAVKSSRELLEAAQTVCNNRFFIYQSAADELLKIAGA